MQWHPQSVLMLGPDLSAAAASWHVANARITQSRTRPRSHTPSRLYSPCIYPSLALYIVVISSLLRFAVSRPMDEYQSRPPSTHSSDTLPPFAPLLNFHSLSLLNLGITSRTTPLYSQFYCTFSILNIYCCCPDSVNSIWQKHLNIFVNHCAIRRY